MISDQGGRDAAATRVPLATEQLDIDKHTVVTGRVRVTTRVETRDMPVRESLRDETVEVTRVPVDREIDTAPAVREADGLLIIPVVEEIVVIEKRLRLVEEIHVRRRTGSTPVETTVALRRTRVEIERT